MILLFAGVLYGRHNIMLRSLQDTMRLPDYPFPAKMDAAWDPYHLLPPIPSDPQKLAGLILDGARKEVRNKTRYLMEYRELLYPMGDVPSKTGVCTDLIVRAYRNAGIDLQVEVYQDRLAHPSDYPRALHLWEGNIPNSSIDHRRTRNLWVWFKRYAESLPVSSDSASGSDWQPGDIVFFGADRGKSPVHVAIISDAPGSNNLPKLIEARGGVTTDQHDLGGYKPNEIHSHFRITDPSRLPHPPKGTQDRP
ncbi:DUF1287 domain-containing protein [Candidatus Sumerlaeota bacterium]|nr:DUF1287 domain-containing protein [Candidatus Sumerlaeota bacterium]